MNRKVLAVGITGLTIGILVTASFFMVVAPQLNLYGTLGIDLESLSIHSRVRVWQSHELVLDEWNSGAITNLGDNMTLYKIFGYASMQYGSLNTSAITAFISIGNDTGTLGVSSTVLPNEWHREVSAYSDATQSQHNFTCTISGADIPAGTQKADCIGLCLTETDDANDLWGYDTFSEVTGIDNTFTINIEFQVSVSHS